MSDWTSIEYATAGSVPAVEDLRLPQVCLCHRASALLPFRFWQKRGFGCCRYRPPLAGQPANLPLKKQKTGFTSELPFFVLFWSSVLLDCNRLFSLPLFSFRLFWLWFGFWLGFWFGFWFGFWLGFWLGFSFSPQHRHHHHLITILAKKHWR